MENIECLYDKQVKQIKATSIGNAIVKLTGIEGAKRDERQEKLRNILYHVITYVNQHPGQRIWENAEVTVYDCDYNNVKISSGSKINKFIVNENFDGKINIKYVVDNEETEFPDEGSILEYILNRFSCIQKIIPFWESNVIADTKMIGLCKEKCINDDLSTCSMTTTIVCEILQNI